MAGSINDSEKIATLRVVRPDESTSTVTIEPENVQEILIDGVLSVGVSNGIPRLGFFVERTDLVNNQVKRVLVARLAMSTDTANLMVETLRFVIQKMVDDGVIAAPAPVSVAQ